MEILGLFFVVAMIVLLLAVIVAPIYLIHNYMTDTLWHETFCTCERCKAEGVKRAVKYKEWSRHQDETRRAVDEMDRAARGRR